MKPISKIFSVYLLIILFTLLVNSSFGQITVKHFNAGWNESNGIDWISELTDVKTKSYIDIGENMEAQNEYEISSIPTIIIFKDGEEVARFQADLSFKMVATKEEVQEEIDEQLMSDF